MPAPADIMPTALTDSHQASDAALAARLACGDAHALDPLYRRHKGSVYRFALLWSGAAAVAADVTQDVFVHLLTRAEDFDPTRGPLQPWLLGIARNFVRRRTGTQAREEEHDPDALDLPPAPADLSVPDDALCAATSRVCAWRSRSCRHRRALVLRNWPSGPYAEAAICGCELSTVRSGPRPGAAGPRAGSGSVDRAAGAATAKPVATSPLPSWTRVLPYCETPSPTKRRHRPPTRHQAAARGARGRASRARCAASTRHGRSRRGVHYAACRWSSVRPPRPRWRIRSRRVPQCRTARHRLFMPLVPLAELERAGAMIVPARMSRMSGALAPGGPGARPTPSTPEVLCA
jgi:RNA polymerase sigma-70 factor (ECF subfamily)